MIPATVRRRAWVHYAACLWALCFAAPHTWWALGSPFGFPGGPANHRLWMASWWRFLYDVVVILLSLLGAVVALALLPPRHTRLRRRLRALAWIAGGLLTLRGVAGLVADGTADPIWWPTFLVGGLLFGSVARLSRPRDLPTGAFGGRIAPLTDRTMKTDVILKRFEQPDEVKELVKGRFEIVRLGGLTIGRATYEPGWRWSEHVGRALGQAHCSVEHVGLVLAGTATAAFADGRVVELRAGELFYIPPEPHDSWVVGDVTYVSLHFLGADHYAR